jgi:hypothetical protein
MRYVLGLKALLARLFARAGVFGVSEAACGVSERLLARAGVLLAVFVLASTEFLPAMIHLFLGMAWPDSDLTFCIRFFASLASCLTMAVVSE